MLKAPQLDLLAVAPAVLLWLVVKTAKTCQVKMTTGSHLSLPNLDHFHHRLLQQQLPLQENH